MRRPSSLVCTAALAATLHALPALGQSWTLVSDSASGLVAGTYPVLAVAPPPARDVYYSFLAPNPNSTGRVWRARLDAGAPRFTLMPGFALVTPAAGAGYSNVNTLTTNRRGEPVVGLSAGTRSDNTEPMLWTWDESAGRWFAPPVNPPSSVCAHSIYRVDRAPNGDLWAICQWHGAYRSMDDGRTFDYVDVSALLRASHPSYFPTRASGTADLGALYSLAFAADGTVHLGTETGGEVYSSDRGATWHPLDPDSTNPMSTMARATASGDDYGTGVTANGNVLFHGFPTTGAYPTPDATRLYAANRAARTITVVRGIPDYYLGGRLQFAALPTGEVFFHSNHDTVNSSTGVPQVGGIFYSANNGLDWSTLNTGINEVLRVGTMSLWIDGNGRGAAGGFGLDGATLYTVTAQGHLYRYTSATSGGPDGGADAMSPPDVVNPPDVSSPPDAGSDASATLDATLAEAGTDAASVADSATGADSAADSLVADAVSAPDTSNADSALADASSASDSASAADGSTSTGAARGCGCAVPRGEREGRSAALSALLGLGLLAAVRRRSGSAARGRS